MRCEWDDRSNLNSNFTFDQLLWDFFFLQVEDSSFLQLFGAQLLPYLLMASLNCGFGLLRVCAVVLGGFPVGHEAAKPWGGGRYTFATRYGTLMPCSERQEEGNGI